MSEERKKILEMLAAGQINADEAERLLEALEGGGGQGDSAPKVKARLFRVYINDEDGTKVRVNLPLSLARFALKFIPEDELGRIGARGINLDEILSALKGDVPDGKLVEVHDEDGTEILIEVV